MTLDKLRRYCQENRGKDVSIVIGYSQSYALEVHERTDVKRRVGQSKFLEEAARSLEPEIRDSLRRAGREKMPEAMLKAGLLIQRESQKLCPVDTSALRASAFTTVEEDLDHVAAEARSKAEMIRSTVLAQREAKKRSKK
jgi:hypothetical protein